MFVRGKQPQEKKIVKRQQFVWIRRHPSALEGAVMKSLSTVILLHCWAHTPFAMKETLVIVNIEDERWILSALLDFSSWWLTDRQTRATERSVHLMYSKRHRNHCKKAGRVNSIRLVSREQRDTIFVKAAECERRRRERNVKSRNLIAFALSSSCCYFYTSKRILHLTKKKMSLFVDGSRLCQCERQFFFFLSFRCSSRSAERCLHSKEIELNFSAGIFGEKECSDKIDRATNEHVTEFWMDNFDMRNYIEKFPFSLILLLAIDRASPNYSAIE